MKRRVVKFCAVGWSVRGHKADRAVQPADHGCLWLLSSSSLTTLLGRRDQQNCEHRLEIRRMDSSCRLNGKQLFKLGKNLTMSLNLLVGGLRWHSPMSGFTPGWPSSKLDISYSHHTKEVSGPLHVQAQIPQLESQVLCLERQDSYWEILSKLGKSDSILGRPMPMSIRPGFMWSTRLYAWKGRIHIEKLNQCPKVQIS